MGSGGSTIGDLFFPDNPNRRRRAQELRDQINAFGEEFKQLGAYREEKLNSIRAKLDALMASRGFNTSQQLEDHVRSILNSSELSNYDSLKNALDLNEKVQGIVWDLVSIIGAASGIILGGAVIAGVMTGGAALAVLGTIGEILAVVAVIVIVFGVIEGAIERDKLRDAINQMWPQRAKIKQAMEQMRVIVNWIDAIDVWLNNPVTSDPATLDALLNGSFAPEYKTWTMDHVYDVLRQMDSTNGSWTNEDPGRGSLPAAFSVMAAASRVTTRSAAEPGGLSVVEMVISQEGHEPERAKFIYKTILSENSCIVERDGQLLKLTADEWDKDDVKLSTARFSFEAVEMKTPVAEGKISVSFTRLTASTLLKKKGCKISILSYSTK